MAANAYQPSFTNPAWLKKHIEDFIALIKKSGWFQLLDQHNKRYSNKKSAFDKTDYHPASNSYDRVV